MIAFVGAIDYTSSLKNAVSLFRYPHCFLPPTIRIQSYVFQSSFSMPPFAVYRQHFAGLLWSHTGACGTMYNTYRILSLQAFCLMRHIYVTKSGRWRSTKEGIVPALTQVRWSLPNQVPGLSLSFDWITSESPLIIFLLSGRWRYFLRPRSSCYAFCFYVTGSFFQFRFLNDMFRRRYKWLFLFEWRTAISSTKATIMRCRPVLCIQNYLLGRITKFRTLRHHNCLKSSLRYANQSMPSSVINFLDQPAVLLSRCIPVTYFRQKKVKIIGIT